MTREVRFYFDFLSPYAWLAFMQAKGFAKEHDVTWDLRPVVFAKLLDATGLVGPAEVPAKRRATIRDVVRSAQLLGLAFRGPPAHPFRSLEALRTVCLFRTTDQALDLCIALADATWGEGRDLTRVDVLADVVEQVGLDATGLAARIGDNEAKAKLVDLTGEAIANGVFGVPTFLWNDEIFWGQDRLPHLAARLCGLLPDESLTRAMLDRPRGADRPGVRPDAT